jgi:hypothetical protein
MEPESQAIDEFVRDQMFASEMAISVDVHSGYGVVDRLWFPYAKTKDPFPDVGEMWALKSLLDKTYPNHVYRIEPQSEEYCTHGDLWDYLYDEYRAHTRSHKRLYLPLSLELGSWAWVKKNPVQAFSLLGFFNPLKPHRLQRQLRRHIPLFDFLLRAVHSADKWRPQTEAEQKRSRRHAAKFWFRS